LVLGNVIAACISPVVLLWAVRRQGIHVQLQLPRWTPLIRRVLGIAGPLVFASTVLVANPVVDRAMVTTLGAGSVTQLEFGLRIYGVPITLFVSALLAPMTARWRELYRDEGFAAIEPSMQRILRVLVVGVVPLTVMILVLRREIVMGILQGGSYDPADVRGTAAVLGALILALPAQIAIAMLTVAFIASENVIVPVVFAIVNVTLNASLDVALRGPLGLAGIALSTAITLTLLAIAELVVFHRRVGSLHLKSLRSPALTVALLVPLLYGVVDLVRHAMPYAEDRPMALLVAGAGLLAGTAFYAGAMALIVPRAVVHRSLRYARTALLRA
jgi:putative peptidoglycan lipid II flippase